MTTDGNLIRTYFKKLGLEAEIADIYLALHSHGPQTISELSRNAKVERTRIYRLIDGLMASNLIEIESHYKRGVIKAAPISNLRILINQREEELRNLQDELGLIEQTLSRNSLSDPASRVQFYRGPEGIRQMLWNQLNAKTAITGFGFRILDEPAGRKFMETYADTFEERNLEMRLLVGNDYIKSWQDNQPKVRVPRRIGGYRYQYITPEIFPVLYSSTVYDGITAYYHWRDGEVFGIEIYNKDIADSQRKLFELLWHQSTPITDF